MPLILGTYYPVRRIVFFAGEGCLIFTAVSLINSHTPSYYPVTQSLSLILLRATLVMLVFQVCLYFFDLYDLEVYSSFQDTATQMTQAFGFGCIALAGFYYLFPTTIVAISSFSVAYLLICILLATWRFFYVMALDNRLLAQPILVLGSGKLAKNIKEEVDDKLDSGYKIVAFAGSNRPDFPLGNIPFYDLQDLKSICQRQKVERIVNAVVDGRGALPVNDLISCKLEGIKISNGVSFYEDLTGKILVETVTPTWIIYSQGFTIGRVNKVFKRLGDIFIALIGLIITMPIILISMAIIKLDPGPVFYTQERVGRKGKPFKLIKFRSMCQDAEKDGAVWARTNDDRVTRYGGFIRKVRIDEIPQLWNILKGDMSFVGPRPERPIFVEQLVKKIPYYSLRHNIKPGLTGWAQIKYPYGASEEDALRKLEYDLYYLKHLSFSLDMSIAFQTIKTVLFKKGAR